MTDWATLLNPEQLAAVTAPEGPTLVLAAAGTGKTRTLTHRVAWLVEQGVDPRGILLLTFTNRAAREMMERAEALVGPAIATLWSGTFHHVCHRILRQNARLVGRTAGFTILDRADAQSLVGKAIKELAPDVKRFPKKEVVAALIGRAANTEGDLRELAANLAFEHPVDPALVLAVAARYEALKEEADALDFDDLLTFTLRLFRERPEVLAAYADSFRHVLVDEYQDTNTIQAQLVDLLASRHRNLMAVGDDFQCIYSWRGADFRNIMEFPTRWQGCRVIKLERNYRSAPEILALANATIAHNPGQFPKTLLPTLPPSGRKPLVAFLRDAAEQNQMVVRHVQRALQAGYRPEDIAILYRAHYHAMELELDLRRLRLPYTLTSGQGLFESQHMKDVIAFLRLCVGLGDLFALQRVLGLLPGVGPKTAERVWGKLGGAFAPARQTDRLQLAALLPKKAQGEWRALDGLIGRFQEEGLVENGNRAVTLFLETWYADYLMRAYDNGEDRVQDVAAFAAQFRKGQPVAAFLNEVALMTNLDAENAQALADRPGLRLSTVHQAKGLEWPVVIVIWCNEDYFPSARAIMEDQAEEERRLFYVAVTRARKKAFISFARQRFKWGNTEFCNPSRFITEMDERYVELPDDFTEDADDSAVATLKRRYDDRRQAQRPEYAGRAEFSRSGPRNLRSMGSRRADDETPTPRPAAPASGTFRPGMRVAHAKFGQGTVQAVEEMTADLKVTVQFDDPTAGRKSLLSKYAHLRILG